MTIEQLEKANDIKKKLDFIIDKISYYKKEVDLFKMVKERRDPDVYDNFDYLDVKLPITQESINFIDNEIEIFDLIKQSLENDLEKL